MRLFERLFLGRPIKKDIFHQILKKEGGFAKRIPSILWIISLKLYSHLRRIRAIFKIISQKNNLSGIVEIP